MAYDNDLGFDRHARELMLFGDVDEAMAHKTWLFFHSLRGTAPVTVYLTTDGGDVDAAYAIYHTITACESRVRIQVTGKAYSSGLVILQAGDERTCTAYSHFLLHYGSTEVPNTATNEAVSQFKHDQKLDKWYNDVIFAKLKAADARMSRARYERMLTKAEYWTAEQALQLGLIDAVV
jgi:ATP-dependent protease ClpP protease subunit